MPTNPLQPRRSLELLLTQLRTAIDQRGLRPLGRELGDTLHSNTYAMRVHRMTRSLRKLSRAPLVFVLEVCHRLRIRIP